MSVLVFFFIVFGSGFRLVGLLPTIIVVYATTIQVNVFQDGLVGNRCNRSLGLTLKLSVRRYAVGDFFMGPHCSLPVPFFFFICKYFFFKQPKCCSVNNIA